MRFLVTGSSGFIGSKTSTILLQQGNEVIGIDNMNDYYDVRLKEHRLKELRKYDAFTFFKNDIEDKRSLEQIFTQYSFDSVINLAARAGVGYSITNPQVYLSTNTLGTLNLLELMRAYSIQKLVLASTSSLYSGNSMPFTEDMPVNTPISPYAVSKKGAELMAYTYHYLFGIDITVVRYFTVYGPSGRPDMSIMRFIKWIDEEKPLRVNGDGTQSRDFTYVDDIAAGTISANKKIGYEIINLGGGKEPVSLNVIIQKIEKLLNKKAIIENNLMPKTDVFETMADIKKAKRLLSWTPVVGIDEGLSQTVEWYLKNKSWLKEIIF